MVKSLTYAPASTHPAAELMVKVLISLQIGTPRDIAIVCPEEPIASLDTVPPRFLYYTSHDASDPKFRATDPSTCSLDVGLVVPTPTLPNVPNISVVVAGSVALNLGSDATGDLFYRNSGGTV